MFTNNFAVFRTDFDEICSEFHEISRNEVSTIKLYVLGICLYISARFGISEIYTKSINIDISKKQNCMILSVIFYISTSLGFLIFSPVSVLI